MPQLERRSDRWVSAALSVVLHGALIGVLIYGWLSFRRESRPTPSLAINATVVGPQALNGSGELAKPTPRIESAPPPKPIPPPQAHAQPPPEQPSQEPPPEEQTVPTPPDMAARQEAARKAAEEERNAEEEAQRKKQELEAQAEAERKAKAAKAAEEAKKAAQAKAAQEAKARELAAEQQQRAEEAKALALNPADLEQSIEAEEKAMAARSGPAVATWEQLIKARIEHAWIRPPTARQGIDCLVEVTEVPGGQVVNAKVGACNGDAAVVQSIQDAAYRASPLPAPPDPALFERDLQIEFKPTD